MLFQLLDGERMHVAFGMTARAEGTESTAADCEVIHRRFRHDRAGRIAGAEEQHVERVRHTNSLRTDGRRGVEGDRWR